MRNTGQADLEYLQASAEALEEYLLSREVYWSLSLPREAATTTGFSRLSLGALLLTQARLVPGRLDADQQTAAVICQEKIGQIRQQWMSHWRIKAEQEFPVRLTLWRNALEEIFQAPPSQSRNYPQEVRWRVMLALLGNEAGGLAPKETDLLAALDTLLRARLHPGPFIWEADLQAAFPETSFWFLYGQPA